MEHRRAQHAGNPPGDPVAGTPRRAGQAPASRRAAWAGALLVAAIVAVVYVVYAAWQWREFAVRSWDLGIFTQLLQNYARLQAPIVTIKGEGYHLLGDHFHPLLVVFAPVYALFPSAFTLLVIQAACFAVAAGVLTRSAIRLLGSTMNGVLLGLAFGLSWGLQYAAEAQFHEIALAVPILTVALCALVEERWRTAALWAGLLVFVKEDLGLTVLVFGLLLAWVGRRWLGLWLAVWGLAWFLIATLVVLPSLNPGGSWAYAGEADPGSLFADPAALFDPAKGHTLLLLVVITGGLMLRSPVALVLLPTLAWRFVSSNSGHWGPAWHYSAVLMPIAFAALLDAMRRGPQLPWRGLRRYAALGAVMAIVVAAVLAPTLPLRSLLSPSAWDEPARAGAARAVLAQVPAGAVVETDVGLMSYLVDAHPVYWIGNKNPVPGCVLIDRIAGGTPTEWGGALDVAEILHPGVGYTMVAVESGYELACR
ncbi:MAG: DUF2079 domain-containing protein [Propioniciclava sp.]|uniref:DUF2079 domain-containing protein n=1 Tax=Propioniciclava sp. TaxID=2038686 RepID=UPI0039E24320